MLYIVDAASILEGKFDYLRQQLPNARDSEVTALLDGSVPSDSSMVWLSELVESHILFLRCFAVRMSILAVRRRDRLLDPAVLALDLTMDNTDEPREALLALLLPWRSADLLGPEAPHAEDRRIEVMGYFESENEDTFTYERNRKRL